MADTDYDKLRSNDPEVREEIKNQLIKQLEFENTSPKNLKQEFRDFDYEEPYRSDILDLAAFTAIKAPELVPEGLIEEISRVLQQCPVQGLDHVESKTIESCVIVLREFAEAYGGHRIEPAADHLTDYLYVDEGDIGEHAKEAYSRWSNDGL